MRVLFLSPSHKSFFLLLRLQMSMQRLTSELYTALFIAYGSFMSLAHSMVTALWSLELLDEHQLRFFSSTHRETRPSVPMP